MKHGFSLLIALVLGACTSLPAPTPLVPRERCEAVNVTVDAQFPSAGMASCDVRGDATIRVSIAPEDEWINPSPWYAVRVTPEAGITPVVILDYHGGKHRYQPKISLDGASWRALDPANVKVSKNRKQVTLQLPAPDTAYYVAGQEIFDIDNYAAWVEQLSARGDVTTRVLGLSEKGREIELLQTQGDLIERKTVLLVGRQHPPEVTGALAMRTFSETVLGDTELAQKFRARFDLVIVPNMNPDGVDLGHWRHNTGGVDLNRDWGPFTQAETQAVEVMLDAIDAAADNEFVLFLDFHSTQRNVFYTQTVEAEPTEYDFTGQWLSNARARLPNYAFERAERHNSDLPTSKNYMGKRFGIPAITYELGDETDRGEIAASAVVFAEEMMKLLLANE